MTDKTKTIPDLPCACATARRAARALTQLYDGRMRQSQIEASQFSLLSAIDTMNGANQSAIGRVLDLEKTTLSRNLQWLKRKGWIESVPPDGSKVAGSKADGSKRDRRERRFVLSATGKQRLESALPAWRAAQDQLRSELTAAEWETMWKVFRVVTEAAHRCENRNSS